MNPIAILLFIAGISTATPPPPKQAQVTAVTKEVKKPGNTPGTPKCGRGGWDGN